MRGRGATSYLWVAVPLMLGVIAAGVWSYRWLERRERAFDYASELMCCLTGVDPVAPQDATRAARRMPTHLDGTLDSCRPLLEDERSHDLGNLGDELQERVRELMVSDQPEGAMGSMGGPEPPSIRLRDLGPLYAELEPFEIQPRGCSDRPFQTEIETVADARERIDGTYFVQHDDDRFGEILVLGGEPGIAFEPDGERPFAKATWTTARFNTRWPVQLVGRSLRRDGHERAFGQDDRPLVAAARWVLWREPGALVGRRVVDGPTIVADERVSLPVALKAPYPSVIPCRVPAGDLLVVVDSPHDDHRTFTVLEATDELRRWGTFDAGKAPAGGSIGSPSIACSVGSATLTWTSTHPVMRGTFPTAIKDVKIPEGPHPQQAHRLTCTPAGCGKDASVRLMDLPALWASMGGYSSPLFVMPVTAEPVGERVLLWWQHGAGLYARLGALVELPTSPTRRILDLAYPKKGERFVVDAVNWPEIKTVNRADAVLFVLREDEREGHVDGGTVFLRLDGTGDARLLVPAEPRK